jgi:hypothetical protein
MGAFSNAAQKNTAVAPSGNGGVFSRVASKQEEENKPSFGGKILRGILKTPAQAVTSTINAGQVALGKAPTQPFSGGYLGEVKPIGDGFDVTKMPFTGGNKQQVKEAVGSGIELASYIPGASGVRATVGAVKEPFKRTVMGTVKRLAKEGAQQGGLASTGQSIQENKGVAQTLANTAIGTIGGAVGAGVLGVAGAGISQAFSKVPVEEVKRRAISATSKALGISGKRTPKMAITQPEEYVRGLSTIRKYATEFDPKASENIFDDTLKGLVSSKEKVFDMYNSIAKDAGTQGVDVDIKPLESVLTKYLTGITTQPKKQRAVRLLNELQDNFPNGKANPIEMQDYIRLLNEELGGVAGGAEKGAVGVVSEFTKEARKSLDDAVSKLGKEYQVFKDEYASLKSIEDSLVRKYQQAMRKKGGGLSEYSNMIANAEMLNAIISANPALLAKSGLLKFASGKIKAMNDPETWLRRAFDNIDQAGDVFNPKAKVRMKEQPWTPPAGQLRLPAGTSKSQGTPIILGSRSQSTVDAQEMARIQLQRSSNTAQMNLPTTMPITTANNIPKNPIPKSVPQLPKKSSGLRSIPKRK